MVSIDDLQEVLHKLCKEFIIGPLEFKMAEICHLENRQIAISQRKKSFNFQKNIWHTTANLEIDRSQMTKYKTLKFKMADGRHFYRA